MRKQPFFLEYQRRWILDESRLKILEKSRQIGMTWATAYRTVRQQIHNPRKETWVSSRDAIQAQLFIEDCVQFARLLDLAAQDFHCKLVEKTGLLTLHFHGGGRIHSLSSNADAQVGKRGSRVLDEFALHENPEHLYGIAYPGITWGGQLEILSTHRGQNNFFYRLLEEIKQGGNPKKFSHHRVTLTNALEQGFLQKLKERLPADDPRQEMDEARYFDFIREGCPDESIFRQEYLCEAVDSNSVFLPYEMILSCEYEPESNWQMPKSRACFMGIDVGRTHDLTVFWVLEKELDCFYTRACVTMENQRFSEQEHQWESLMQQFNIQKVCIDQTGIGRQLAERGQEHFGLKRVEGITLTPFRKEALAYQLRRQFELQRLFIPSSNEIRSDLYAVKRQTTATGQFRIAAERGKNGHADRFWALALALKAAESAPPIAHVEAFRRKNTSWS